MHRSLQIPEITGLICRGISPYIEDDQHLRSAETLATLAALARTSQAFSSPALDLLWRDPEHVRNVLRCLPDDVWDRLEDDTVSVA
jgi:hypothetical protein